jgi:hypothetical protein
MQNMLADFIKSHWIEYVLVPFVIIPLVVALAKVMAKHKFHVENEDYAIGFDLIVALAATTVCFWATIAKEANDYGSLIKHEAGISGTTTKINEAEEKLDRKQINCFHLLRTIGVGIFFLAFFVKMFGWKARPTPWGWPAASNPLPYELRLRGVLVPLFSAVAGIAIFCWIVGI